MKILQIHNHYRLLGGEDTVVAAEQALLVSHGHTVIPFIKDNADIDTQSKRGFYKMITLVRTAFQTLWNVAAYRETRALLRAHCPDIVHCHNTFPQFSPSVYYACKREGIPVVQTLHNYRLLCLNACLFRRINGNPADPGTPEYGICEDCLHLALKLPGLRHRCYRDSRSGSFVVMCMLFMHRILGTWRRNVGVFIAVSEFERQKFIASGIIPEANIVTKPNFLPTRPSASEALEAVETEKAFSDNIPYALFAGRLSPEKGCTQLVSAWARFKAHHPTNGCQLLIAGEGPIGKSLEQQATTTGQQDSIKFIGHRPKAHLETLMKNALFLVFPSISPETFGLTVLEAGMTGTASIVASSSAAAEMITDGETGILFNTSDPNGLHDKLAWAFSHPEAMKTMGTRSQIIFKSMYSEQANYEKLIDIYQHVIGKASPNVPEVDYRETMTVR